MGVLRVGLVRFGLCLAMTGMALGPACERQPAAAAGSPAKALRVVATIPPMQGLIEPLLRGSGVKYELRSLMPPGVSEHGYEIPPDMLAAIDKADVVVMVGFALEPQVDAFLTQHPRADRRVVKLADVVAEPLPDTDEDELAPAPPTPPTPQTPSRPPAANSPAREADHSGPHPGQTIAPSDPHAWLDPILARAMADSCAKTLKAAIGSDAAAAKRLDEAVAEMNRRIDGVDRDYRATISAALRRTIVVGHDAYGYLARRYNLDVVAITGLNAGEPQPGDVKRAADAVRDKGLTTIFVEPQLSPAAAQRLAQATGAKIATLDPLGDGDWFALMDKNLAALKDALGQKPSDSTH